MLLLPLMEEQSPSASLDATEWKRVREILHDCLDLTAVQRSSFLDRACGSDRFVRAQVESLLHAADETAWLDTPAIASDIAAAALDLDRNESDLRPGTTLGHYRVVEKLGQGGMGVVYRAVDETLGRFVALKVLPANRESKEDRKRFIREARAASALNHSNIVTIYEFGSDPSRDFMAMEYIEGDTLEHLLARRDLPLSTTLDYAAQAAGALGKAHAAGIVHRDLKPGNIMVTKDGVAKVLDFGLAKWQEAPPGTGDATVSMLTHAGAVMGTPSYMSPEQVLGEPVDQRSDVFSFGIILYQIACGERPFRAATMQATLVQITGAEPARVRDVNPAVPAELAALIDRCLKKNREERFGSMEQVAAELRSIVADMGSTRVAPEAGSSRRGLWLGLVTIAVSCIGYFAIPRREPPAVAVTHSVAFSLQAQRMKDGRALGEPYMASLSDTFQGGWKFRLALQARQAGYLYLINEGPSESGTTRLWILSPRRGSTAELPTEEKRLTAWYVFDQNPGTERLWVVWSSQPVHLLDDALSRSTTGEVTETAIAGKIHGFLIDAQVSSRTDVNQGAASAELRGTGNVLARLIELRHR